MPVMGSQLRAGKRWLPADAAGLRGVRAAAPVAGLPARLKVRPAYFGDSWLSASIAWTVHV